MNANEGGVVVVGAAGHQGSAVLKHLSLQGLEARLLLDDRGEGEAHGLRWSRAEHVSFDDAAVLENALRGVGALFVVLDDPESGPADRLRHGRAIGDAAARAGISHIVYSSATGPDHHRIACDLSREIEEHLRSLDVPLTVLRPATVMEEIAWYWLSQYGSKLVLATPFEAQSRLPMIAVEDIGALSVAALSAPAEFIGKTLDTAGDVTSPAAVADVLAEALRQDVAYSEVQVEGVFIYPEASAAASDIAWLRGLYPGLHTLRSWLDEGGGLELCRRAVAHARA
ncbi:MAG: NmrA family NAD(P)-binding protein [Thermoleophilia bacterium]